MSDNRITAYADAAFSIARAEGNLGEVEDELFRLGRVLESSEELRSTLTDPHLPASRRQQVVEDLLDGKATTTTIAIVSMIVGAGRAADLPKIAQDLVQRSATDRGEAVAEVRSAVPLTDEQIEPPDRGTQGPHQPRRHRQEHRRPDRHGWRRHPDRRLGARRLRPHPPEPAPRRLLIPPGSELAPERPPPGEHPTWQNSPSTPPTSQRRSARTSRASPPTSS